MNRVVLLLVFLVSVTACTTKIDSSDIAKINGYWEIEKVELPDGTHKDYAINETYDYFEIKNSAGFRKKVAPQFNGTYLVNDLSENVRVLVENKKVILEYTTPYAKWKEELIEITDSTMVVRNAQENEYHYKKAKALNLTANGKKAP